MKCKPGLSSAIFLCVCTIAIVFGGRLYGFEVGKFDLHGVPGKIVIIERFVFSGGWISSRHRHTGPLFVYVIEGNLIVEMENKEPYTIKKGEVFQELPNLVMQARNASSTGPVEFVVFQVLPKGEPFLKRVY